MATSHLGDPVTFTATVMPPMGGAIPSGSVSFYDGTTLLGVVPLTAGMSASQAGLTTSGLALGGHSITAVYGGNAAYAGATSAPVTETVTQAGTPTATLSLATSAPSVVVGNAVTFTASLSTTGSAPTGSVTFYDGATALGTVAVGSGMMGARATLTTSALGVGVRAITATYSGDASYAASTAGLTETVQKAGDVVTLGTSWLNGAVGQAITLTATVAPGVTTFMPTGFVYFYDNGSLIATILLGQNTMNVQAAFTTSGLAAGPHTLTAVYLGDADFVGGSSSMPIVVF